MGQKFNMKTHTICSLCYNCAKIIVVLFSFITLYSCKDNDTNGSGEGLPIPPEMTKPINLSYTYLDVSYEATEEKVHIEATDDWTVKSAPEWVSVTPTDGGEGKNQIMTVSIEENPEYNERTGDIIVITADNQGADTLTIRQFGISAYIPIDYDDNRLTDFDLTTGTVTLECGKRKPTVRTGASIVIPTDTVSYIRVVRQVNENGNKLTLQTEEGDMTDVFVNQEFTLSTTPATRAIVTRNGNVQATDEQGVIHPVEITASMPDGSMRTLYDLKAQAATRTSGDIINAGDKHPFFDKEFNADGKVIGEWGGARLEWEKCNHHINVTGNFHFTFGMKTEVSESPNDNGTVKVPKGDLLGFWCFVDGSAAAEMILKLIAEAKIDESIEEETVLKDLLTAKGYNFKFMVGTVPVIVNVNADVLLDAALEADAEAVLTAGMSAQMNLKAGFIYTQGDKELGRIWQAPSPQFTLHKPKLTAKANVDASASLYPRIRMRFFNFAGPDIAIKPYILDHLEFDGEASTGGKKHAQWSNRLYYRTDMEANLSLDFIGMEWSSATLKVSTPEKDLHRTPDKIELVSPQNGTYQEEDKPITVTLSVKDFSVTGENGVSADAAVQFVPSKGIVDASLAISNEKGEVTVNWTPDPKTRAMLANGASIAQTLEAQVLGKDNKIISKATFAPDLNRDREILEAFYRSANGDNWSRHDNWCTDKPLNEWYGIQTDYHPQTNNIGRVTTIDLTDVTGISGTADFRGMSKLEVLNLGNVDAEVYPELHKDITSINVSGCNQLQELDCRSCNTSTLEISGCNSLATLMLHDNLLTELDLAGCPNLENLFCINNQITDFDFSKTPEMRHLVIGGNPYTNLDVSMLTKLDAFHFGGENMTAAPIMSQLNQTLTNLSCDGANINEINLSILPNLKKLDITNTNIRYLDLSQTPQIEELRLIQNQISTLDFSKTVLIQNLDVTRNEISSLDISQLNKLKEITINDNPNLTSVKTSAFPELEVAILSGNSKLNTLELTNCKNLKILDMYHNGITYLNASRCEKLEKLGCHDNKIQSIDMSYCPNLQSFSGNNNNLEIINIAGSNQIAKPDIENYLLKTVTVDGTGYNRYHFQSWGEYDKDKYLEPAFKNGRQYPRYIIVQ